MITSFRQIANQNCRFGEQRSGSFALLPDIVVRSPSLKR
jgi:hypothetical protein